MKYFLKRFFLHFFLSFVSIYSLPVVLSCFLSASIFISLLFSLLLFSSASHPDNAEAHCGLGRALRQINLFDESVAEETRALELGGPDPEVYFQRAESYRHYHDDKALLDSAAALRLRPGHLERLLQKADIERDLGHTNDAMEAYSEAIRLHPNDDNAFGRRGSIYFHSARYLLALEDFSRVLTLNPDDLFTKGEHAEVYQRLGDYDESAREHVEASALCYHDSLGIGKRGWALALGGRYQEALTVLNQSISMNKYNEDGYRQRAFVYLKLGLLLDFCYSCRCWN